MAWLNCRIFRKGEEYSSQLIITEQIGNLQQNNHTRGEALSPFLPGNNKAPRCYRKKDRNYVEKTYTLQELVNMNICVCLISISLFLLMLLFP
jgi:hypothetical protein